MRAVSCVVPLLAALVISAAAQAERLSEAAYNAELAAALDAASSRDRRVSTIETFYSGSQVTGVRRIVSDFAGNDTKRIDVTEDFNGKKIQSNSITLNGQFFCKDGDKAWKRADKDCARSGKMMAIPDGAYEYSVEQDPKSPGRKIFTRRASFADTGVSEREAMRLKFIEITFSTDGKGQIVEYREMRRGGDLINGWSSTQVTKYEYDPAGMKIVDPTKENL